MSSNKKFKREEMPSNKIHKIINPILFISFVTQAITSIYFLFELRVSYMGLIAKIHAINGIFMILLTTMHIALNWN